MMLQMTLIEGNLTIYGQLQSNLFVYEPKYIFLVLQFALFYIVAL